MSLVKAVGGSFSPAVKGRGGDYFRSGRVRIVRGDGGSLTAQVSGSRRKPYVVEIDWAKLGPDEVVATCTCPHYKEGNLCKHIWAMLLAMDKEGLDPELSNPPAKVLHKYDLPESSGALDDMYDDCGDDYDEYGDEEEEYEDGDEDDEDDEDDWHYRPSGPARREAAPTFGDPRRGLSIGDGRSIGKPRSGWKRRLTQVFQYATTQAAAERVASRDAGKQRQAWFVLSVAECLDDGRLVVHFRQRETRQTGEFGKIKKLTVQSKDIPRFVDEEDGRLVEILIGNAASDDVYGYHDYDGGRQVSRAVVLPATYEIVLPRLCATGRFVWQMDSSLPVEEGRPMAWDGGDPWRLRLSVEDDPQRRRWRLLGELVRGGDRVPLSDAVLLLDNGLVLFPDRLARLNVAGEDFAWIAVLREQSPIEVPYSGRDALLDAIYRLPTLPEIELPPALQLEQIVGTPRGRLEIKSPEKHAYYYSRGQLYANVHFVYGDHSFDWENHEGGMLIADAGHVLRRDRAREAELLGQLADLGLRPVVNSYSYRAEQADLSFPEKRLPEVVLRLIRQGWIVESEGVRIRKPGAFNLSVTSGIDWFELDGQIDFEGVAAPLPALLKALRHREKYIRLDDGSQGMLPEEWLKKYGGLAEMADRDGDGDALRFAPTQALLLDALLAEQENVRVDRQFADYRDKLRSFEGVKPTDAPRGFHGTLREYQKEGLGWLHFLREFRLGGCLADDMGLGKTVQVLALLQSRRLRRPKNGDTRKPSIVVVPKSLVFNWLDEAARFTPGLRAFNYTGIDRKSRLEQSGGFDLLMTTYGTLRRDIVELKQMPFDYAILDESQAIKNHLSQAAKASRLLDADHRLAMTGTPVENHLGELWSLFEFLNPGMLGRSAKFQTMVKNNGDDGVLTLLARALRPFLLRRTKGQVLAELPEKTEQTLLCRMSAEERSAYDRLRDYYRENLSDRLKEMGLEKAKIHVLEALLRLRQAACHPGLLDPKQQDVLGPKLETLLEQLREVIAEGHKALVFSQFTSLLAIVRRHLDSEGIVYEYLDGRTRRRGDKVKRFQADPACPLFLISLKAGGHGLNLTAADYVFILDPWWNPAVEAQAIDRAHRIGQTRPVFAYRIICADTVEDKILELQRTKRELADAIVSADQSIVANLTAEDLALLLS
ncbi:MAG: SNF2-related protein [Planctomycetia bacterium]|nr:SNF2-related protein [Planctomycetia bacterium]